MNPSSFCRISVIVPVYNTGYYLQGCLDSIIRQTMKDLEILLVDDGSKDSTTLDILDEYQKKDSRIRVIRKKNGGQSSARNTGLSEACGIYVAFVDHDDLLNPYMYETLHDAAVTTCSDVAECRFKPVRHDILDKMDLIRRPSATARIVNIRKDFNFLVNHIHIWNRIYRRDFLDRNALKFDDELLWEEDVVFSFKTLTTAESLCYLDVPLYFHVEHFENTTSKLGRKVFHMFKAHDMLSVFFNERNTIEFFKEPYHARVLKDVIICLNIIDGQYEKDFFDKVHKRIMSIPIKQYKKYFSGHKRVKLIEFIQKGNYEAFKRHQDKKGSRKMLFKHLFNHLLGR
jgi:glycosyltransferase involved in cell wall biosynthesis